MAKGAITANREQRRRVEELGRVPSSEETAPEGTSPFDIGAPPVALAEGETAPTEEPTEGEEAADPAQLRTHEEWAKRAGYLPAFWRNSAGYRKERLRAIAPTQNPKHWIYAGALAHHRWPVNKEMTAADFKAAVAKAHDFTIR